MFKCSLDIAIVVTISNTISPSLCVVFAFCEAVDE